MTVEPKMQDLCTMVQSHNMDGVVYRIHLQWTGLGRPGFLLEGSSVPRTCDGLTTKPKELSGTHGVDLEVRSLGMSIRTCYYLRLDVAYCCIH